MKTQGRVLTIDYYNEHPWELLNDSGDTSTGGADALGETLAKYGADDTTMLLNSLVHLRYLHRVNLGVWLPPPPPPSLVHHRKAVQALADRVSTRYEWHIVYVDGKTVADQRLFGLDNDDLFAALGPALMFLIANLGNPKAFICERCGKVAMYTGDRATRVCSKACRQALLRRREADSETSATDTA